MIRAAHRGIEQDRQRRRGGTAFTLVELLIAVTIVGILASTIVFAMYGVQQDVKVQRTRLTITKIHQLLLPRLDDYRARAVAIDTSDAPNPRAAAYWRLCALRLLMRLELPDRITDFFDPANPSPGFFYPSNFVVGQFTDKAGNTVTKTLRGSGSATAGRPALWQAYRRRILARLPGGDPAMWTKEYQGAECLYLIMTALRTAESDALSFFASQEIGDVDADGMNEILDAWGRPIQFLRWAPGFGPEPGADSKWGSGATDDDQDGVIDNTSEAGWPGTNDRPSPSPLQDGNAVAVPDPYDPIQADPRWDAGVASPVLGDEPFALIPLIYSAGRDQIYEIRADFEADDLSGNSRIVDFAYGQTVGYSSALGNTPSVPNDPYFYVPSQDPNRPLARLGQPFDANKDGFDNASDNVTNHYVEVR